MIGVPKKAVSTPTGISARTIERVRSSRPRTNRPPSSAEAGSKRRWSGPDQHAGAMRHDKSDPADDAADRDLRRHDQRDKRDDRPPQKSDVDAERSRVEIAERQQIYAPAQSISMAPPARVGTAINQTFSVSAPRKLPSSQ